MIKNILIKTRDRLAQIPFLIKTIDRIAQLKVFLIRVNTYVLVATMAMTLYLTLSNMGINIKTWYVPVLIASLFGVLLIGWLDKVLGFHRRELEKITEQNPQVMEMLEILRELKDEKNN